MMSSGGPVGPDEAEEREAEALSRGEDAIASNDPSGLRSVPRDYLVSVDKAGTSLLGLAARANAFAVVEYLLGVDDVVR